MPSPIAHLGAGYAIYRFYKHRLPENRRQLGKLPFPMILVMGLSLLPDLDIIAAILFEDMQNYHNNFSHSLLLGLPVALLIAATLRQIYHSGFWLWFLVCLISYDLHVVMDALTAERGVMMFWPFSQNRFVSPIRIFYGLKWGLGWFSILHLWTIFTESIFVLVLITVVNYIDRRNSKPNISYS
jgi:membrane-bound metal-dependent hydrolase YbcI (DUF457 family)